MRPSHRLRFTLVTVASVLVPACARYEQLGELRPSAKLPLLVDRGDVAPRVLEGRVLDSSGRALPGSIVSYRPLGSREAPRPVPVDAAGRFRIEELGRGKVELVVRRIAYRARTDTLGSGVRAIVRLLPDCICDGSVVRRRKPRWRSW